MTATPPGAWTMTSSWVDLTSELAPAPPPRAPPPAHYCCPRAGPSTPPFHPLGLRESDYLHLLSGPPSLRSTPLGSALMSRCSTCRNSGAASPKSPPNSPNVDLASCDALEAVYINRIGPDVIEDFLWDWSSSPFGPGSRIATPPRLLPACRRPSGQEKVTRPHPPIGSIRLPTQLLLAVCVWFLSTHVQSKIIWRLM
jgi:hypothetical protein